jgi:hypothetical protein
LKYQRKLSAYRDHSLAAAEFRSVWSHLYHCPDCREEVEAIENLGTALRELPAPALPQDLMVQLRMRLSQERARRERPSWLWRLRNQWGHMALPGTAGLLSAVLLFGLLGIHFDVPLHAAAEDVPLVVRTPARLRDGRPLELESNMSDLVVQVLIDPQGHVVDYDVVEGSYTPQQARNLRNNLLFAVFDPAMSIGPLSGGATSTTLVLSYRRVHVRG